MPALAREPAHPTGRHTVPWGSDAMRQTIAAALAVSGLCAYGSLGAGCAGEPVVLSVPPDPMPHRLPTATSAGLMGDGVDRGLIAALAAAAGEEDPDDGFDLSPVADRSLFDDLGDAPLIPAREESEGKLAEWRLAPRAALGLYLEARSHWLNRRFAEAAQTLEKARAADPKSFQVNVMLGRIYLLAGKPDLAKQRLEAANAGAPENFEGRYHLGRLLFEAKDYPAAAEQFKQALTARTPGDDLGPRAGQAWLYYARCLHEAKEHADAVKAYRAFLQAVERGVMATSREEFDFFHYSRNPAPVFLWLSHCFVALGKAEKAIRAAEDAVQIHPAGRAATVELIMLLLAAKQPDRAVGAARSYVSASPETKVALELLEDTFKQAGKTTAELIDALRELRKARPDNPALARFLADKLKANGGGEEAARLLEEIGNLEKSTPEGLIKAAALREQAGDRSDALRILARGLTVAGQTADGAARLAKAVAETVARETDLDGLAAKFDAVRAADKSGEPGLDYAAAVITVAAKKPAAELFAQVAEKRPRFAPAHERLIESLSAEARAEADPARKVKGLDKALSAALRALDAGLGGPFLRLAARTEWEMYRIEVTADTAAAGVPAERRLARIQEHLAEALKADGDDAESRMLLAAVLLDQRKVPDALREAMAAVRAAPEDVEAAVTLIRTLIASKKCEEAVAAADAALKKHPGDWVLLRAKAKALAVMNEFPAAAEALNAALAAAPADKKREIRSALAEVFALPEDAPEDRLLGVLVRMEKWDEAAEQLKPIIDEDKKAPKADDPEKRRLQEAELASRQVTLARRLTLAGKTDEAKALLEELRRADPKSVMVLLERVVLAARGKDDVGAAAAVEDYRKAAAEANPQARPRDIDGLLVAAYLDAERTDLAERLVRQLIENDADKDPDLRLTLARILASPAKRDFAGAEKIILELLEQLPDNPVLLKFLSGIYTSQHKNKEAAEALEKVFRNQSDDVGLNNDLGYTWADLGVNLEQAKAMVQKAVDAEPYNAAYRDSLGWVYYKLGDFAEARRHLEKAAKSYDGADPVLWDHLGDVLWRTGEKEEARKAWNRSVELFDRKDRRDPIAQEKVRRKLAAYGDGREPEVAPLGDK